MIDKLIEEKRKFLTTLQNINDTDFPKLYDGIWTFNDKLNTLNTISDYVVTEILTNINKKEISINGGNVEIYNNINELKFYFADKNCGLAPVSSRLFFIINQKSYINCYVDDVGVKILKEIELSPAFVRLNPQLFENLSVK